MAFGDRLAAKVAAIIPVENAGSYARWGAGFIGWSNPFVNAPHRQASQVEPYVCKQVDLATNKEPNDDRSKREPRQRTNAVADVEAKPTGDGA